MVEVFNEPGGYFTFTSFNGTSVTIKKETPGSCRRVAARCFPRFDGSALAPEKGAHSRRHQAEWPQNARCR
jgi:hypothetical protein